MKPSTRTAAPATLRQLSLGTVVGSAEPQGGHAWRGLRFAQPPVGDWRWRAPRPAAAWTGTQEALQHGPMAPQFGGLLAAVPAAQHGQVMGDEDCLSLNIFAPAWAPDQVPQGAARRPVMVWIHGGGNAVGTAQNYDVVRNLAVADDVLVVTVQYRLGVLGWFAHPALQQQPGVSDEERSGNFGLLDLVAALRWVRDHIGAFGGDPGNVTLFGESAGGQQVLLLMASPLAAGLFHRAIAQSPVCETFSMDAAIHGLDSPLESQRCGSLEVAARVWAQQGPDADTTAARQALAQHNPRQVADWLRSQSVHTLLKAHRPGSVGIYLTPRPVADGVVLPAEPLCEAFASGRFNRVPVILGSNRDEYRTFLADKPEHSRLLFGQVPLLRDRAAYLAQSSLLSAAWRAAHVDAPADALLASGHPDVWTYRFDWDEVPAVPFIRPDLLLGAAHAMEMSFVFRDDRGEFDIFKVYTPFNRRGREQLSAAMAGAWTALARHGAPTLPGGQAWPRRPAVEPDDTAAGADSLVFDTARDGGLRMAPLRCSLQALRQGLLQGRPDLPHALRPRLFASTFLWSPLFRPHDPAQAQALLQDYRALQQRHGGPADPAAWRPKMEI